jgi:Nucleotidyltransferase
MTDVESIARLIDALSPWLRSLVIVGGWAHRLHRLAPGAQTPSYEPLRTQDADIAFSTVAGPTGDMAGALKRAGFEEELVGDHEPPVTSYRLGKEHNSFYAEFLTPLVGSGTRRDGTEDATVRQAGVTAQKLRYLELLLMEPITVQLTSASSTSEQKALSARIANPVTFIAQKLLIRDKRTPNKQAQDVLYTHDTLELFAGELAALQALWRDRLKPSMPESVVKRVEALSISQFAVTDDAIRGAARIVPTRKLSAGMVRAACQYGVREIFG